MHTNYHLQVFVIEIYLKVFESTETKILLLFINRQKPQSFISFMTIAPILRLFLFLDS